MLEDTSKRKLEDFVIYKTDLLRQKNRFVKKVEEQLKKLKVPAADIQFIVNELRNASTQPLVVEIST